jgi:beta-galactosidase
VFDGIATNATVWLNGTLAARHFGGYTALAIDIVPFARFGEEPNVLAVQVDARDSEGWWYEGAGLYRGVWIEHRPPVHIARHGLVARPVPLAGEAGAWTIPVTLDLANTTASPADVTVEARCLRPKARRSPPRAPRSLCRAGWRHGQPHARGAGPRLWSPEDPALHRLETRVLVAGVESDREDCAIGLRTLRFTADRGLLLNGQPYPLRASARIRITPASAWPCPPACGTIACAG